MGDSDENLTNLKAKFSNELWEVGLGLVDAAQLQFNVWRLVVDATEAVDLKNKHARWNIDRISHEIHSIEILSRDRKKLEVSVLENNILYP